MKSVTCTHAKLEVAEGEAPDPIKGQVRIEVERCGICGSDVHARTGIDDLAGVVEQLGYDRFGRSHQSVVFGHEFSGAVAEYGPGTKAAIPTGSTVVALPLLRTRRASTRSASRPTRPAPMPSRCSCKSR